MEVTFYKNVPFEDGGEDKIYFTTETERSAWLDMYKIFQITNDAHFYPSKGYIETANPLAYDCNYVRIVDDLTASKTLYYFGFIQNVERVGATLLRVFIFLDRWETFVNKNVDGVIGHPQIYGTYAQTTRELNGVLRDLPEKRIDEYTEAVRTEIFPDNQKYKAVAFISTETGVEMLIDSGSFRGSFPTDEGSIASLPEDVGGRDLDDALSSARILTGASQIQKARYYMSVGAEYPEYTDKSAIPLQAFIVPVGWLEPYFTEFVRDWYRVKVADENGYRTRMYFGISKKITTSEIPFFFPSPVEKTSSIGSYNNRINLNFRSVDYDDTNVPNETFTVETTADIDTLSIRGFCQNQEIDLTQDFMVDFSYNQNLASRAQNATANSLKNMSSVLTIGAGVVSTVLGNPTGILTATKGILSLGGNIAEQTKSEPSTVHNAGTGLINFEVSRGLYLETIEGINDTDISGTVEQYGLVVTGGKNESISLAVTGTDYDFIKLQNVEKIFGTFGKQEADAIKAYLTAGVRVWKASEYNGL